MGRILLPSDYWAIPPLYTLSGWGSVAGRNHVWKFCPLLKAAAEKCHQDFTPLVTKASLDQISLWLVKDPMTLAVRPYLLRELSPSLLSALAELSPPHAPPACQEPGWGSKGFLHLSHMFTLLHFTVLQPTGGKKSQKPMTKKKLLLKGRKVLGWSLLNLFTLLEGVWSRRVCPLFLLCVLALHCWLLGLFLFDYIQCAGCLHTQGQCTHMTLILSVNPRHQPHSWSLFALSIHCSKYNYQQGSWLHKNLCRVSGHLTPQVCTRPCNDELSGENKGFELNPKVGPVDFFLITFLPLTCMEIISKNSCSMIFPRMEIHIVHNNFLITTQGWRYYCCFTYLSPCPP